MQLQIASKGPDHSSFDHLVCLIDQGTTRYFTGRRSQPSAKAPIDSPRLTSFLDYMAVFEVEKNASFLGANLGQ